MKCISSKVIDGYQEFARQVIQGATSTKWDDVIFQMATENVHVGRNLNPGECWVRARKHTPDEMEPFIKLENIGMNRNNPKQGRCNEDGESLLYICKSRDSALAEISAKEEDIVSVGHFIIRKTQKVVDLTDAIWNSNRKKYGTYNSNEARHFLLLLVQNYFKAQNDKNIYRITNHISKMLKAADVDGIKYCSTHWKDNRAWVNVALVSQKDVEWRYTDQWQIIKTDTWCHNYDCKRLTRIKLNDTNNDILSSNPTPNVVF